MNIYTFYRLFLLCFTLYTFYQFARELLKYKPYYDKVPNWIKNYMFKSGGDFILNKFAQPQHRQDLIVNGILLLVLIVVNGITFIY